MSNVLQLLIYWLHVNQQMRPISKKKKKTNENNSIISVILKQRGKQKAMISPTRGATKKKPRDMQMQSRILKSKLKF